jgi:RimJ/RimL family protein N-acetyltransferase
MMRAWIYFEDEWCPDLLQEPVPEGVSLIPVAPAQGTSAKTTALSNAFSQNGLDAAEGLLITATDAGIRAARRLQLAVTAYNNPLFPGQTYEGVRMVIEGFDEVDTMFLQRIYEREHGIPWTITQTERCVIREFSMADMRALIELYDQPGVTCQKQGFMEPLYPLEEEWDYEEAYISNMYGYYGYGMWLVIEKTSQAVIGRAGLEHRDFGDGVELEIGYVIDPKWQRQGIATEVCRAIIDFARENLDFPRLNALTDARNTASIALLDALGFSYMEDTTVSGSRTRRYEYPLKLK